MQGFKIVGLLETIQNRKIQYTKPATLLNSNRWLTKSRPDGMIVRPTDDVVAPVL